MLAPEVLNRQLDHKIGAVRRRREDDDDEEREEKFNPVIKNPFLPGEE